MSSGKYNGWAIEQGANFITTVIFKDSAGDPIDITGNDITMELRNCPDGAVILEISTDNGTITIPTGTDGKAEIDVPATTTDDIEENVYDYDMFRLSAGIWKRELRGKIRVRARITVA